MGKGLADAYGFVDEHSAGDRDVFAADCVLLANPLSSDMDVLRPSLLPGLIHSLRHNASHKNYDVAASYYFSALRITPQNPALYNKIGIAE